MNTKAHTAYAESGVVEQSIAVETYLESLLFEEADMASGVPVAESDNQATSASHDDKDIFECLLFKVGGFLTLSVSTESLNGIVRWKEKPIPVAGHAEWELGSINCRGKQVNVIDIAKFVIPENHKARRALKGDRKFKHVILIGDGHYGLACDDLEDVLQLLPDQVRWREHRTARPWLAGTATEKMCAILDIGSFEKELKENAG